MIKLNSGETLGQKYNFDNKPFIENFSKKAELIKPKLSERNSSVVRFKK